jgi:hypothetical protein
MVRPASSARYETRGGENSPGFHTGLRNFLAIADCLLLASGVILFIVLVPSQVSRRTAPLLAPANTTRSVAEAGDVVKSRASAAKRLPANEDGTRWIDGHRDGWNAPLRYEREDNGYAFSIRSAGADASWNTDDDVVERFAVPYLLPPPADFAESLAYLRKRDEHYAQKGLDWLIETSPRLDDAARLELIALITPCLAENRTRPKVEQLLAVWMTPADTPRLVEFARQPRSGVQRHNVALGTVQILESLEDRSAMLAMINHPYESARDKALEICRRWNVEEAAIVRRCLDDLKHESFRAVALQRLAECEIDASLEAEVLAAVRSLPAAGADYQTTKSVLAALERLAVSPERTALLDEMLNGDPSPQRVAQRALVQRTLVKQADEGALAAIARSLDDYGMWLQTRSDLETLGPGFERHVWPKLSADHWPLQQQACQLLAKIGTKQSIAPLEQLANEARPHLADEARKAIAAIEARQAAAPAPLESPR